MKNYPVRKEHHLADYDYATPGYYFVTICTEIRGKNILASIPAVGGGLCPAPCMPVLTPIGRAVADAIEKIPLLYPGVEIDISCIMPDHIHLIIALTAGRDRARPLPDIIGRMKSYTAMQYRKQGGPFGYPLWQDDYYDHVLRNDSDLAETRDYIHQNPLKSLEIKD